MPSVAAAIVPFVHPARLGALSQIRRLTEQMLEHARASQWEDAIVLQKRQRALLDQFLESPVGGGELDYVIGELTDIKRLCELTQILAERERSRVGDELYALRRNRQVANSYEVHALVRP